MSEYKLLSCPFCGGEAELIKRVMSNCESWWYVTCLNGDCTIRVGTLHRAKKEEAIKEWNTRKMKEKE